MIHKPVLLKEVREGLYLRPGDRVLDATVGLGGHAEELLEAIGPRGSLIGLDRDQEALDEAQKRLSRFGDQVKLIHGHFGQLQQLLGELDVDPFDAALFDLGVSSLQLARPSRGFSFAREGPLDMRMDTTEGRTAAHIVNHASCGELADLFRAFGEERFASRIARQIVRERPFSTTTPLAEVIRKAASPGAASPRRSRIDAATRTFQAIRIAVNRELELLPTGIAQAMGHLRREGRLAVLSYHSLEDRIVKNFFRDEARAGRMSLITRKPIRPSAREVAENPRSRSARLRIGEKR